MPALCANTVKELINHSISDVFIDGVGGDFACFPNDRVKLFTAPSSFSLCSSSFINGVLLGAGTCDASFIIHSLRVRMLATSVQPYVLAQAVAVDAAPAGEIALGVNPTDMAVVLLIAQLLVQQTQISFLVNERTQICQFADQFPQGGGLWAELSAVGCESPAAVLTGCEPCPFVGVFSNGTPDHDNRFNLIQPIGVGNNTAIGAVVQFDPIATSDGQCINVLDVLSSPGTTEIPPCPTTPCPANELDDVAGIVVKADFQVDGLLCRAVC
jgi:hypothetical protein